MNRNGANTAARRAVPLAVFLALLGMGGFAWISTTRLEPYASFERPDHHYQVVVLRKGSGWPGGVGRPGQSGDAPGEVRLVDRSGHVLESSSVDMVQVVDNVDWQDKHVVIKLVADWPLPD